MPPKTWQSLERFAASIFGSTRNPLSGANNRNDFGGKRVGDIITKPGENWMVECKHRAHIAFHTLFRKCQKDDVSKTLFLFTHQKQERYDDSLVTMEVSTFKKMWPLVSHLFKDDN